MDALTKVIFKSGISFSESFQFRLREVVVTLTVSDIVKEHRKTASKEEFKNTVNHIKKANKLLALRFIKGMGQKQAIENFYGNERAKKLEYVMMSTSYTNEPVPFRVGEGDCWILERQNEKCYLYRHGEEKSVSCTIDQLFERMLDFDLELLEIDIPNLKPN
ncbi:hypothetical protein [Paenibacillus sp. Leaf72]|uniref:hypothetical protein n=1 Tax=Paenibacillus sp. Leaf72 TaxID=1736234 RepID=UPI000700FDDD|nr:hypothetical protein [Paenibacillus sp. Leaf72]KQN96973.1 hypothetical protein ASF12_23175 [Paenibacillus sp. Leaf72]